MKNYVEDFFSFIDNATTAVQAIDECERRLIEAGYSELDMDQHWKVAANGKYYVKPSDSMLTAFTMPNENVRLPRFKIVGSHVDSPALKIKPSPEIVASNYVKLNTEVYSGPLINTWFDRPLSIAGRVALKSDDILKPIIKKVDFKRPLLYIPNLAIHMIRDKAKGFEIDKQKHLLPILSQVNDKMEDNQYLYKLIANELGVEQSDILDFDLFVYVFEKGQLVGEDESLIVSPRIDDLGMAYTSLVGLIESDMTDSINMVSFFDHEDVGSLTLEGADSSTLYIIMEKLIEGNYKTDGQLRRSFKDSFIISADGAHGTHPNVPELNDITNKVLLNEGIVIKQSAKKSYASDCETSAVIQQLCDKIGIKCQKYVNHSNVPGGKTIGPIISSHIPIRTVDIGVAMLAMHSAKELMGKEDFEDVIKLFRAFYNL